MSLFSIITVTRNNGEGLARTYASLAAQSLADYEWIVIDGASSDSTLGFMKDKPALLVSEPDKGIYDAMNKGLERASGDFLIFMNAGDCFAGAQVLEELSHVLRAEQTVFAYGDAWEEQSGGRPFYKRARRHHHIAYGMFTHHQAMVYKRAALGDMRYDLRYKIASDYDLTAGF
ncbi:MAG: glycosyltransferase [Alphaproteobacteria bacterium]|nr:glycosyltransferase [Alphaproteobacteria bacterium]